MFWDAGFVMCPGFVPMSASASWYPRNMSTLDKTWHHIKYFLIVPSLLSYVTISKYVKEKRYPPVLAKSVHRHKKSAPVLNDITAMGDIFLVIYTVHRQTNEQCHIRYTNYWCQEKSLNDFSLKNVFFLL